MTLAFVFPGQGARVVLQAVEWASRSKQGQALVRRACAAAECTLDEVRRHGGRLLEATRVLQPLLTAASLTTMMELAEHGVRPAAAIGHSLGEVAALACAGVISPEAAVDFAAARGAAMEAAASQGPGGLVALGSLAAAHEAMEAIDGLEVALLNAPDEVVVAGPSAAVADVVSRFGGRRLAVAGAWHSRAMQPAVDALHARVAASTDAPPRVLLPGGPASTRALPGRLVQPVDFVATLESARLSGVDAWLVVGPGHVLRGLLRRNLGAGARLFTSETAADLQRTLHHLRSAA